MMLGALSSELGLVSCGVAMPAHALAVQMQGA
jgi:hypothetical protein